MSDAAKDDSIEMIAALARTMMNERRGRFLDASCGTDAELRARVEARLSTVPECDTSMGQPLAANANEPPDLERGSIEAIALDALLQSPDLRPGGLAGQASEESDDLTIIVSCTQQRLSIPERLRLFQRVCHVVDQDHRRGFIHGALTPERVRVREDGAIHVSAPEPSSEPLTDLLKRGYASPEQVLGEPPTVATDVYQLGLLLYQLLTGRGPYRLDALDTNEICKTISEQAPERPSTVRTSTGGGTYGRITGDLESIVLHALHKEPERRYATTAQFAEDVDRYFQGRPVVAHRQSRSYRVRKFIARHPLLTTLGCFTAIAVTVGFITSTLALKRVEQEYKHAETSFQIAHRAADDLFTLIDQEPQFERPGLQPVRSALLENLLHYYENILDLHGGTLDALELAAVAQERIARIDRRIGLLDVAAWQMEQAISRYDDLITRYPGEMRFQASLTIALDELGETLLSMEGQSGRALTVLERALGFLEAKPSGSRESSAHQRELARVLGNLAEAQRQANQPERAQSNLVRAIRILNKMNTAKPPDVADRVNLAADHVALGRLLGDRPEVHDQAVEEFSKGIKLRQIIAHDHPDRLDQLHEQALDLEELASLEQKAERLDAALEDQNQAVALLERLVGRFPDAVPYLREQYLAYDRMSRLQAQRGERKTALELAGKVRGILEPLAADHPNDPLFSIHLAQCHSFVGRLHYQDRHFTEAFHSFQRAVDLLESLPRPGPAESYELAVNLALCVSLIGAGPSEPAPDDEAELSPADRLRRQVYGARAVSALESAVKRGFTSLETCRSAPDLDSLRGRPDFQKLTQPAAEEGRGHGL